MYVKLYKLLSAKCGSKQVSLCAHMVVYIKSCPLKVARRFHKNYWWHRLIRRIRHFSGRIWHLRVEIILKAWNSKSTICFLAGGENTRKILGSERWALLTSTTNAQISICCYRINKGSSVWMPELLHAQKAYRPVASLNKSEIFLRRNQDYL